MIMDWTRVVATQIMRSVRIYTEGKEKKKNQDGNNVFGPNTWENAINCDEEDHSKSRFRVGEILEAQLWIY